MDEDKEIPTTGERAAQRHRTLDKMVANASQTVLSVPDSGEIVGKKGRRKQGNGYLTFKN